MAARQDQTLQMALIVFAVLLVLFTGLTYYFFKSWSDAEQKIASLEEQKREQTQAANVMQARNETYLGYIGLDPFADPQLVEEQFGKDMTAFAAALPEGRRKYRDALEIIAGERDTLASTQAVDKQRMHDLQQKLQEVEAGHQAQISQYQRQIAELERKATADRKAFNEARRELNRKQADTTQKLAQQQQAFDQARLESQQTVARLEEELKTGQRTIEKLIEERQVAESSFEVGDGEIRWVNQANSTVWINLGSADALQPLVTFSVFDSTTSDAGKAEKKGSIEVVRLLGESMAEARITDDNPRNPILPGDSIYSPVWHPGKRLHFALTGIIDLDNDGLSDLQLAKDLITMAGGVVDAAPAENGTMNGKMSVETRYLVLGKYPERASDTALRDTWNQMSAEAKSLGVKQITLTDFINQVGYEPQARAVGMGESARSVDFRPRSAAERGDLRPRSPLLRP